MAAVELSPQIESFSQLLRRDQNAIHRVKTALKQKVAHAEILTSSPYKLDLIASKERQKKPTFLQKGKVSLKKN